jgi:hypothetical protein
MGFATSVLSDISSPICETVLAITDARQVINVIAPKKTIELHNPIGSNIFIYYGDITVTSANGIPILPGETKIFAAVENGFKIYLVCATGEIANCRYISYRGR